MYLWSVLQFRLLARLQNEKNTCRQPAACSLTENNILLYDAASWTSFIKNPSGFMPKLSEWGSWNDTNDVDVDV